MFAVTTTAAAAAPRVVITTSRAATASATASSSCRVPPGGGLVSVSVIKNRVVILRRQRRGASLARRAGEGNPFIEGWLDLTEVVSGGGGDLGVSELAENLGSDVYMDINGWWGRVEGGATATKYYPSFYDSFTLDEMRTPQA
jgi:hypothetical protein